MLRFQKHKNIGSLTWILLVLIKNNECKWCNAKYQLEIGPVQLQLVSVYLSGRNVFVCQTPLQLANPTQLHLVIFKVQNIVTMIPYTHWPDTQLFPVKCSKLSLPRAVANNYLQHGGVWTVGRILAWWGRGGEGRPGRYTEKPKPKVNISRFFWKKIKTEKKLII